MIRTVGAMVDASERAQQLVDRLEAEVRHQAKIRGSSDSLRKSGSQETPRWRKADSNP
jgi:hypothetical protein